MVNVGDAVLLGPRTDREHAQGRLPGGLRQSGRFFAAGQRSAHAHADAVMEKIAVAVVQEFPGKAEEFRGGFLLGAVRGFIRVGGRAHELARRRGLHREAPVGCLGEFFPCRHGSRVAWRGGLQGLPQVLAPLRQTRLDAPGALGEDAVGRDEIALKIKAQVAGFDLPQRRCQRELR